MATIYHQLRMNAPTVKLCRARNLFTLRRRFNLKPGLLSNCFSLLVLCGAFAVTSFAQSPTILNTKAKDSLRGLSAVRVVVEISNREERQGLTQARLYEVIEARLRQAGIRVVTEKEPATTGNPTLYVKLMVFTTRETEYTWLTDVQLRQEVSPLRRPAVREMAATWQNSAIGLLGGHSRDAAIEKIYGGVGSIVDWFIRDHQSVNP
jgi:hypothetical protein